MATRSIGRSDRPERWRWGCPRGHVDWAAWGDHIYCKGCLRLQDSGMDVDPYWDTIVDRRTGQELDVDDVEIEIEEGEADDE